MVKQKKKVCREIVTIGLPLPNLLEYTADVSSYTRECLDLLKRYSKKMGIETHEIKERSINVASNHSNLVENMIGDWILVCGSDHTFSPTALDELLRATEQPPYPKIVGAVCNYRGAPYRWTFAKFDDSGERLFPLVPFYNCDPALMSSAEVQEVDVIGSGFTLYHRSVFDKVPPPWFTYETRRPGMPEIEKVLRDWDGDKRLDEWLEGLTENPESLSITDADVVRLKAKAKGLRGLLAKFRRPGAIGMDFQICLRARDYGIKSYVHWGVVTHHLTLEHTHPQRYVQWLESDPKNWDSEVMSREDLTFEKIAIMEGMKKEANKKRKEWEVLVDEAQKAEEEKMLKLRKGPDKTDNNGSLDGKSVGDVVAEKTNIEVVEEKGSY